MKRLFVIPALLLAAFGALAQTPPAVACPAGSNNTSYSYWGGAGTGYDWFGKLPSIRTFFALKLGACSNTFLETIISTGVGPSNPNPGYASLAERMNYQIAHVGNFGFEGHGQVGVLQQVTGAANTVTTAIFGGGAGISFDVGAAVSKGRVSLPVVFSADYVAAPAAAAPANSVKPSYSIDIRKTF